MSMVIIMIALLSVGAIPALSTLGETRRAAAAQEFERLLLTARAQAMATGRAWGVEYASGPPRVRIVRIPTTGAMPEAAPASGTGPMPWMSLSAAYPGVDVQGLDRGDGASVSSGTIWFDNSGLPALRAANGTRQGPATRDAIITLRGGATVRVRQGTGLVERS
jgi:hypothetical protein